MELFLLYQRDSNLNAVEFQTLSSFGVVEGNQWGIRPTVFSFAYPTQKWENTFILFALDYETHW